MTHQLKDLDDAWRCLEVSDVEPDLEGLGVGAGVGHHRHVGLGGGLGWQVHRPVTVSVHHAQVSSVPGQMASELLTRSGKRSSDIKFELISSTLSIRPELYA